MYIIIHTIPFVWTGSAGLTRYININIYAYIYVYIYTQSKTHAHKYAHHPVRFGSERRAREAKSQMALSMSICI